jgi:hypothetical protein
MARRVFTARPPASHRHEIKAAVESPVGPAFFRVARCVDHVLAEAVGKGCDHGPAILERLHAAVVRDRSGLGMAGKDEPPRANSAVAHASSTALRSPGTMVSSAGA